jgi:multidrug efflux pump subunit AcrA (membrane-fusion protein)
VRALCLLLLIAGCGEVAATEETWLSVARDDLVLEVDVTGTLKATRASPIGPPGIPDMWDFKIVKLATEGTEVKRGQQVLTFDASELQRQLAERTSERDQAAQEIVKKRIDQDLARREGELKVTEAGGRLPQGPAEGRPARPVHRGHRGEAGPARSWTPPAPSWRGPGGGSPTS